ncbi:MAG: FAD:protein FMN transferase [Desulfovibrionaceae bacterium]
MNRRDFLLRCSALSLTAGAAAIVSPSLAWCSNRLQPGGHRVERTKLGMGTFVTVAAVHQSGQAAGEAVEAAFAEMDRLQAVLSRYDESSALFALNNDGRIMDAPSPLAEVVDHGLRLHRLTSGGFDPTVAPVVDLLRSRMNPEAEMQLSAAEVRAAVARTGPDKVCIQGRDIAFAAEGAALTLDGVAKGYIVDRMSEALAAAGVADHLVNAGGDVRTSGRPAPGQAWRVGLQDPVRGGVKRTLRLRHGGLATSGGYANFYGRSRAHHHIVKPGSGASPNELASATVFAPTVQEADGLSTACMVLGLRRGSQLIASLPGREACFVLPSGAASATPGFPA